MPKNTLAAIIFAFASALFFILVMPQYDAIKTAREAVKSRQSLFSERAAILDNIRELDNQAQSRRTDISRINAFIPARKQIDEIVTSIQKITEQSGLQLSSLTTTEAAQTNEAEYRSIFIGLDVVGAYPAFVNFLKLLEQSLRLYDISEVTAVTSTVSPGNINVGIKMNAYYLK